MQEKKCREKGNLLAFRLFTAPTSLFMSRSLKGLDSCARAHTHTNIQQPSACMCACVFSVSRRTHYFVIKVKPDVEQHYSFFCHVDSIKSRISVAGVEKKIETVQMYG